MISREAIRPSKKPRVEDHPRDAIVFTNRDLIGIQNTNNEPVVVSMTISKHPVKRILIDSDSSTDVLFYDAFVHMNLPMEELKPVLSPLVAFNGESINVEEEITLPVTAGTPPLTKTILVTFTVVYIPSAYNAILGRPSLNQLDAMISTRHLLVRFMTDQGVGEMKGDDQTAKQCFQMTPAPIARTRESPPDLLDHRELEKRRKPTERLVAHPLDDDSTKTISISASLSKQEGDQLLSFLRDHADIFAWSPSDMPGIPPEVITHKLNVNLSFRPVRQKKRNFAAERQEAIKT